MPKDFFEFKQFSVKQDKCAMKIGTDSVLLGAWVNMEKEGRVLDVGTGTGILSLMLSQRYTCYIDAIEIESDAAEQAMDNFNNSPWRNYLNVVNSSFQDYVSTCKSTYELIISNPPYFTSGDTSGRENRANARHTVSLNLTSLLELSSRILNPSGTISLILPYDTRRLLSEVISKTNLWLSRETLIKPNPDSAPERMLIELSNRMPASIERKGMFIEYPDRGGYSEEFIGLTQAYYLKL